MSTRVRSFSPRGASVTTSVGTSSTAALTLTTPRDSPEVRFFNNGTGLAYVEFGTSAVAAAVVATSMPLAINATVITIPLKATHYRLIAANAATPVIMTPGVGL